jgi:hypothetical protein
VRDENRMEGEKVTSSGYLLKVKPMGSDDGLEAGYERKKGKRDDF